MHAARAVRSRLRDWLREIGAHADDISDVVHAISEFVENAVEHGYSTEVPDGVVVDASLAGDGNLHVAGDRPRNVEGSPRRRAGPRPRPGDGRSAGVPCARHPGRGRNHCHCDAPSHPTGELRHRHHRSPGHLVGGRPTPNSPQCSANPAISWSSATSTPTPQSTLDRQIAVESRSGIAPLTIDLSGVTHLGSAGRQRPGRRARPGARTGRRLCADCPARKPCAPHLVNGSDPGLRQRQRERLRRRVNAVSGSGRAAPD